MDPVDVLRAKAAITELAARYGHHCDHPGWDEILDMFAEDAVFDASAVYNKVMTGRAELREFYETAPVAVAHHPTSLITTVHDAQSASTVIKMLVFFHRQVFSVDYNWELVAVGGDWRIRRQTIAVIGRAAFAASGAA